MKERNKHLCTFALGALFVLASCDAPGTGGGSDSSVLPPIEESTSSSDGAPTIPVNKEILAKKLNEIVEAKSYRLKKISLLEDSDEPNFEDVYRFDRYVRLESKGLSHILRENIENPALTSSYEFSHEGGSLELLSIDSEKTEDGYAPMGDLSSFDWLSPYRDEQGKGTFTSADILMNVDEYVVNDFGLVYTLACMANLKERAANEQFVYATVSLEKSGDLSFVLVRSTDGFTFTDYAKGTFTDVNAASSPLEEEYFSSPSSFPRIEDSVLPSLQKDSYAFTASIWEHQDDVEWGYEEGTNVLEIDPNRIRHSFVYDEHYYENIDGQSYEVRLSSANKIEKVSMEKPWSDYVYLKDILNSDNLMKVADGHYRYVGSSPFSLFYGLTLARSLGSEDVERIDFFVKDGKLTNVEAKFNSYTDPTNFYSKDWYAAHISVEEGTSFAFPSPLDSLPDGSTEDIAKTLSYFQGSFQLKLYDANDPSSAAYLTYSNVPGNRYLLREDKVLKPGSMDEYSVRKTGYALNKEDKLVHFLYTSQMDAFALSEPEEKTLEEVLNMNISPNVLKKTVIDGSPAYNLRVPIYDMTSAVQGYNHIDSIRPMTFRLFYKNNVSLKPTHYSYRYEYNNGMSRGEEIGEFVGVGDDEIVVDTDMIAKVKELTTFQEPTTWEMEENVYPTLLSFFGERIAKFIPYVYEPTLFGDWYAITTNIVNGKPTHVVIYQPDTFVGFDDPTDFMGRLEDKIRAIPGMETGKDSKGRTTYYVNENGVYTLGITLGDNPKEGIDLYIPD